MVDRRILLQGMGALGLVIGAGVPAIAAPSYDAAGYIADLRAAGYVVRFVPRGRDGVPTFAIFSERGFGPELTAIGEKWGPLQRLDPEWTFRVAMALEEERAHG